MWVVPGRTASPSRSASPTRARSNVDERRVEPVDRPAGPEPEIRRDLVVPRAAGVELAGDRPEPLGQGGLEVEVDVLERRVPARARRSRRRAAGRPARRRASPPRRRSGCPARPRPRTWAIEPSRSSSASAASTSIDRPKAATCSSSSVRRTARPRAALAPSRLHIAPGRSCRDPTRSEAMIGLSRCRRPATTAPVLVFCRATGTHDSRLEPRLGQPDSRS